MPVITAEEFINLSTKAVEISGFEKDEKLTVMLKKISMTTMMVDGKIPNELLYLVDDVFDVKASNKEIIENTNNLLKQKDNSEISEMIKLMDIVCEEAMIQPKYNDIKNYMTDTQKNEVFSWVLKGVNDLKPINEEPKAS